MHGRDQDILKYTRLFCNGPRKNARQVSSAVSRDQVDGAASPHFGYILTLCLMFFIGATEVTRDLSLSSKDGYSSECGSGLDVNLGNHSTMRGGWVPGG